jgi:hypothetical protein
VPHQVGLLAASLRQAAASSRLTHHVVWKVWFVLRDGWMYACSGARHGARIWRAASLGRLLLWCFCTSLGIYQGTHQECCLAAVFSVLRVCPSSWLPYALGTGSLPTTSAGSYFGSDNQAVGFVVSLQSMDGCFARVTVTSAHGIL